MATPWRQGTEHGSGLHCQFSLSPGQFNSQRLKEALSLNKASGIKMLLTFANDIEANGFGFPWGQSRSYSNKATNHEEGLGYNWYGGANPYLVNDTANSRVAVVHNANSTSWFSESSGSYSPLLGSLSSLEHVSANNQFKYFDPNGRITVFNDFAASDRAGEFIEFQTEGGASISVTATA